MTNTLALQKTSHNSWLVAPANMTEMMRFAEMIAASAFCPKDMKGRPGDVLAAIQMGAELGVSAMQALQNIAVINGKPSIYGDLMLALVLAHTIQVDPSSGVLDVEEWYNEDKTVAYCRVTRLRNGGTKHETVRATEREFSMADAEKAKLTSKSGPWKEYPTRMLMFRARGFALRDACPDIMKGLITREEAEDYQPSEVRATTVSSRTIESSSVPDTVPSAEAVAEVVTDPSPVIKYRGHPHNGEHMSVLGVADCVALCIRLEQGKNADPGAVKFPDLPAYLEACQTYARSRGATVFTTDEYKRLKALQEAVGEPPAKAPAETVVEVPPDEDDLHICVHPDAGDDPIENRDIRRWGNSEHLLEYGTWLADHYTGDDKALRIDRVEKRIAAVAEADALLAEVALAAEAAAAQKAAEEPQA